MTLSDGQHLSHYKVLEKIGQGGMGEVYRAEDTNLSREVAIKVLPEQFTKDPQRLARFEREAKLLAQLNHPNIAAIYGFEKAEGVHFLALELVEGETLAKRVAKGPLPVEEALEVCRQIAEGVEAAHEKGVIHRDLKPANVKVTPEGKVKILDFGLAKAFEEEVPEADISQSPTLTEEMTRAGVILGTAAFMSPEQAKGQSVDKRADIFAFGCVLYELVTGKRAFQGETITETLGAIIHKEPNWDALPAESPPTLSTLLRRCLQKDPKQRIRDIGDVRLAMEGAFEAASSQVAAAVVAQPVWRQPLPVAAAAVVVTALAVGLTAWSLWPSPASPRVTRLAINPPVGQRLHVPGVSSALALSPDGTRVVYLVGSQSVLVARALDELDTTVLYREGNVFNPFFSPDGRWVGFNDQTEDTIKRVAVTGGPVRMISRIPSSGTRGATWGEDDTIIYGASGSRGLWQVPAAGGTPEPLTTLDESRGEFQHVWPELLPGGKAVLFTIRHVGEGVDMDEIVVRRLASGEQRVLVTGGSYPKYAPTGHLLYHVAGTLWAVPFDLDRLEVTGNPVAVLEGVLTRSGGAADFAVAQDGSLVYVSGTGAGVHTLVWVDRQGQEEAIDIEPSLYRYPRLSPDGTRVALDDRNPANDLWVWNIAQQTRSRLTVGPVGGWYPVWTRDGTRLVYDSQDGDISWKSANDTGMPTVLVSAPGKSSRKTPNPYFLSPDGMHLVFRASSNPETRDDLAMVAIDGTGEVDWLLAESYHERNAELSPNGRWMAYESDESGQFEVYVRPFPNVEDDRVQVSNAGGSHPLWSRDGRELFYHQPNGGLFRLMSVAVDTTAATPTQALGSRQELLDWPYLAHWGARAYDVSQNGQRFLAVKDASVSSSDSPQLYVILNWFEELKRLVPTN